MLEPYADTLAVLTMIFGTLMSLAYVPQLLKMHQRKSSADISVLMYFIFLLGMTFWLLYGFSIHNLSLIVTNIIGLFGVVSVIFFYYRYKLR